MSKLLDKEELEILNSYKNGMAAQPYVLRLNIFNNYLLTCHFTPKG